MNSGSRRLGIALAWPITIPIFAGFIFLGIAYGIYATGLGLPWFLPILMSAVIFAGSMEFLAATLLFAPFDPLGALLLTLVVNARHFFYQVHRKAPSFSYGDIRCVRRICLSN